MDERDLRPAPMAKQEQESTVLYGCAAGHLVTKNDESWSGPCDVAGCKETPAVIRKREDPATYEAFYADRIKAEADYARRRTEPLDAKEEPVLDAALDPAPRK